MLSGNFGPTLSKYKPQSLLSVTPITPVSTPKPDLLDLWEKYVEFKRLNGSPNYLLKELGTVERVLRGQLPTRNLEEAVQIRDWAVANKLPDAAKRFLTQIASCCAWSLKIGLIGANPFGGMTGDLQLLKNARKEDIDPFTASARI